MKSFFGDFNCVPYFPHPTSTYISEVTIVPRVCGIYNNKKIFNLKN